MKRESLAAVLLLVDASIPTQQADLECIDWLCEGEVRPQGLVLRVRDLWMLEGCEAWANLMNWSCGGISQISGSGLTVPRYGISLIADNEIKVESSSIPVCSCLVSHFAGNHEPENKALTGKFIEKMLWPEIGIEPDVMGISRSIVAVIRCQNGGFIPSRL